MLSLALALGQLGMLPRAAMAAGSAPEQEAQGKPPVVVGELTDERTATTKVYELSDGTRRASVAQQPVHYQDESGQWDDIVTALVPAEAPGAHEVAANDLDIELGTDALGVPTARIQGDGFVVGVDLAGETENVKVCLGSEATYLNVAPHASLSVEARPDGFKQEVVLDSKEAPNSYTFDVAFDGLELRQGIGGLPVLYRPGQSEPVGDLGRLFVFDSAGEGTVGTTCPDPVTSIQPTPGGAKITYTVPRTWLDDPARVYPVVIDPTATIYNVENPARYCPDTLVSEGNPTTVYGQASYLSAGYGTAKTNYSFVESGLYYCSQRYYDPMTCQWITRDPARADGEESAYQYCSGDPVGKVDPSGLAAQLVLAGIVVPAWVVAGVVAAVVWMSLPADVKAELSRAMVDHIRNVLQKTKRNYPKDKYTWKWSTHPPHVSKQTIKNNLPKGSAAKKAQWLIDHHRFRYYAHTDIYRNGVKIHRVNI